jgi:hypothetical protein
VLIINQRGLILQALSNVDPAKAFVFVSKNIRISYTRLENLVILASTPGTANLDALEILRSFLPAVNVVLVSFGERARLERLNK